MRAVLHMSHTTDKVKAKDKRSFARSQRRWKMMNFCLVFIAAIIAQVSMGAVVKSALGARGVVFGGKADVLYGGDFADMFDAVLNRDTPHSWTSAKGLTVSRSDFEWVSYGLQTGSGTPISIFDSSFNVFTEEAFTIELGCLCPSSYASYQVFMEAKVGDSDFCSTYTGRAVSLARYNAGFLWKTGDVYDTRKTMSIVVNGNSISLYSNGAFVTSANDFTTARNVSKIDFCGWMNGGIIFFLRVYPKALDAARIAANYQTDVKRFGLP